MKDVNLFGRTFSLVHIYIAIFMYRRVNSITLYDKSKSYAVFNTWNITNVGKLELRFKTQTLYCLLLYEDDIDDYRQNNYNNNNNNKNNKYTNIDSTHGNFLQVLLNNGKLEVTQQIIDGIKRYKKTLSIGHHLNDLRWHTLTLQKYDKNMFQVRVDDDKDVLQYHPKIADDVDTIAISRKFHIRSKLYIGGLSDGKARSSYGEAKFKPRFVGCIEGLSYASGSMNTVPEEKSLESKMLSASCLDACAALNPCKNFGKCVNVFTRRFCDCFGTGYDGERCTTKSDTINLGEKDFIKWTIPDRQRRLVTSLRFRFKTAKEDGLIFYTKRRGNILAAELVKGKLRVAVGNAESTTIPKVLIDAKWHTVEVERKDSRVSINVDDEYTKQLDVPATNQAANNKVTQREPVYFGGIDNPEFTFGLKSKNNFVGCLQQLLYNKEDVIYKVTQKINSRIEKHGRVGMGCPYNKSNIPTPKATTTLARTPAPAKTLHYKVIKEIHTNDSGLGQTVIVWITAAIVIGTILIMISAACVVHHLRLRHHREHKPKSKAPLVGTEDADENENSSHKGSVKSIIETALSNSPTKDTKKDDKCREADPLTKTERDL